MHAVLREIRIAALEAPQIYFAPLIGATKEMKRQWRLMMRPRPARSGTVPREGIDALPEHPARETQT